MRVTSSSAQQALEGLAARLREIRHDANLSGRALATLSGWHPSKVSKIEHGRQAPTVDDIAQWCAHCDAEGQRADLVASLRAVEGMFIDWRRLNRAGLLHEQQRRLPLWQRTQRFRIYSSWIIPGPVQTRDYVAVVLTGIRHRRDLPDDLDAAIQARADRQQLIYHPERQFAIVIEESVLYHSIGGVDTMAAQLGHLITVSTLPSISLGIIPRSADRSEAWPIETFNIFDNDQVAVELVSGHLTITQPSEISQYTHVFQQLAVRAIYGPPARALIANAIAATAKGSQATRP